MTHQATRFLAGSKRVFKSENGKLFTRTAGGGRTYRPKATHFTRGTSKFVVMPHNKVPYGMKPKSKYSTGVPSTRRRINSYATLQGILSRRRLI
jgi:hypothetical protein